MKKVFALVISVILMFTMMLPAFAEISPIGEEVIVVSGETTPSGAGTVIISNKVIKDGEVSDIEAIPSEGYEFDHWEIVGDGEYEIVDGDLNSSRISIRGISNSGNIRLVAHFKLIGEVTTRHAANPDVNPVSPKTGDFENVAVTVAFCSLLGIAVVVYASKKHRAETK